MSVVELHPEDLLDREAEGEITEVELERLEKHVSRCASCRMERLARADFRREEEPLEGELDVQRLLSEVLAPGADREVLRVNAARRRRVAPRWRSLLLVAAALLVGGVAAAAGWNGLVARTQPSALVVVEGARSATAVAARGGRAPSPASLASTSIRANAVGSANAVDDSASTHPSATDVAATMRAISPLPSSATVRARDVVMTPASTPPPADAAGLFLRANAARRAGDHTLAEDLYRTLLTEYSGSLEANQSRALLGHVLLEDGEPGRALRYFDEYLSAGGPLAEDVISDRAAALARLGRESEESAAWSQLLERYPRSVHADRARSRLQELGSH